MSQRWCLTLLAAAACAGSPDSTDVDEALVTTGCTISIAGPSTATYGDVITLTATASCPSGAADVRWNHQIPGSPLEIVQPFGSSQTLTFDTSTSVAGTNTFTAAARPHGSYTGAVQSAPLVVTVADTVPSCTAVTMVSPASGAYASVGGTVALVANATCPAGVTADYQFTAVNGTGTYLPITDHVTGPALWQPTAPGTWQIVATARSVGSHVTSQVKSRAVSVIVEAAGANVPPTAAPDVMTMLKGNVVSLDVTANDSDPDGDTISVIGSTAGHFGTTAFVGNVITYTPTQATTAADHFTYTISDGRGGLATGAVTVSPQAITGTCTVSVTTTETAVTLGAPIHVTVVPSCSEGIPEVSLLETPPGGTQMALPYDEITSFTVDTGGFTQTGSASFTAKVRIHGDTMVRATSARALVTINDLMPSCTGVRLTAPVSNATVGAAVTLAAAATCPAGETAEFQYWVKPAAQATWDVLPGYTTGSIVWNPPASGAWNVSAVVRAQGNIAPYRVRANTVNITVSLPVTNQPPVAESRQLITRMNDSSNFQWHDLASDPDNDVLTLVGVTQGASGTVTAGGGYINYTPNAGFYGTDEFTYTVSDGRGGTATGTITELVDADLIVMPDGFAPTSAQIGTTFQVDVLANDVLGRGASTISFASLGPCDDGCTVAPDPDGYHVDVTLLHAGTMHFNYALTDGILSPPAETVTLVVDDQAPVAHDDAYSTSMGTSISDNALTNDTDPEGQALSFEVVSGPEHGSGFGYNPLGAFTFNPAPGFSGIEHVTYRARDIANVASNVATITFVVHASPAVCGDGVVDAPEQCDDGNTVNGDGCEATCVVTPPPTAIVATGAPASGTQDAALPLFYEVRDSAGNIVKPGSYLVSLAAFRDNHCTIAAHGQLYGAVTMPTTAGAVEFDNVFYSEPGEIYVLASSPGLASYCAGPIDISASFTIAAGTAHTCALSSGGVKCWGFNNAGTLGNGANTNLPTPQQVIGLDRGVVALGGGGQHVCAAVIGAVYCWGLNSTGQLGDGTLTNRNVPSPVVSPPSGVIQIVGGDSHTCALSDDGSVSCWGDNTYGQLGAGDNVSRQSPVVVSLPRPAMSIAAGSVTTCAVLDDGSAWCWGYNDFGELGNGMTTNSNVPVQVQGLANVTTIAPGVEHTCALAGGTVSCWGHNSFGQLGNGTQVDSLTPQTVSGVGSGSTSILSGGQNFNCLIASDGGAWCWGQDLRGQLGDNRASVKLSTVPINVVGLSTGTHKIHAGYIHACAYDGDHLWCWGWGSSGQLGDGANVQRNAPVQVVGYGS